MVQRKKERVKMREGERERIVQGTDKERESKNERGGELLLMAVIVGPFLQRESPSQRSMAGDGRQCFTSFRASTTIESFSNAIRLFFGPDFQVLGEQASKT
jgi:hypothetical protein